MKIFFYLLGFINSNIGEVKASICGWTGAVGLLVINLVDMSIYAELIGKILVIIFVLLGIILRWREYKTPNKKDENRG